MFYFCPQHKHPLNKVDKPFFHFLFVKRKRPLSTSTNVSIILGTRCFKIGSNNSSFPGLSVISIK